MSASPAKHDPTPEFVRQVIGLYREDALAGVHFPDLDLDALHLAEQALLGAQLEVERIETQLTEARLVRDSELALLEAKAERALAYARVFAGGNAELSTRLNGLGRKKPALAPVDGSPSPRRTRSKRAPDAEELFGAADGGEAVQPRALERVK
ncbi:MAG TPA: hypothetical protein VJV78_15825 [Polyangiales bacterium]|nr:hypothetical protein [Polyangiales bacterium]